MDGWRVRPIDKRGNTCASDQKKMKKLNVAITDKSQTDAYPIENRSRGGYVVDTPRVVRCGIVIVFEFGMI